MVERDPVPLRASVGLSSGLVSLSRFYLDVVGPSDTPSGLV
jgi:hypothetical protein